MRVVFVGFFRDTFRRDPEALLEDWDGHVHIPAALAARGAEAHVVLASHLDAKLEKRGVHIHLVNEWLGRTPVRQAELIRSLRPDVVHVHGLTFPRQTICLASRLSSAPMVLQDHADKPARGLRKRLQASAIARADAVTFTAKDQATPFVDAGIISHRMPIFEVVEGSTTFEPGDRAQARHETGLFGDPCVLWVGNLDQNKDPLLVLSAAERAGRSLPDLQLFFVFRAAPLEAEVRATIEASPFLREHVRLIGELPRARLQAHHRAADFFMLGSHSEGSGYSMIEALACGTTPIVTDIPSFRKMSGNGRVASLTPVGAPEPMADALIARAKAPQQTQRQTARHHFEAQLSYSAIGNQLETVYSEVTAHVG